jgi:hypothetical protein
MSATNRATEYKGMPEDHMTFKQAAEDLGVSESRVRGYADRDVFPTVIEADDFFPKRLLREEVLELKHFGQVQGGQPVRRPRRKKTDWTRFAAACAKDAHENYFPSRRGTWYVEDLGVVVLFNNNPYEKYPALRDEELAEFRRELEVEGIRELGYATYADGYTYALVLGAGRDRVGFLTKLMDGSSMRVWDRMPPDSGSDQGSSAQ